MTEKEYINLKALATIKAARQILLDIIPELHPNEINEDEYIEVIGKMYKWVNKLKNTIDIKNQS